MSKILRGTFLPMIALLTIICFSACKHDYSPDLPLPETYGPAVFTGNNNKMVYAVNAKTGAVLWKTAVDGEVHATPVLAANQLWVCTAAGTLYEISYKTGKIIQQRNFPGADIEGTPMVFENNLLVPVNNELHYINVNTLDDIWTYTAGGMIVSSPAAHYVAADTATYIFIATAGNKVVALDDAGNEQWAFSPPGALAFHSSPCVVNDSFLYIGNDNGKVYAVNTADGSSKWTFSTNGEVLSSPIEIGGNVLVGSNDRYLYSIDSATGLLRWKVQVGDKIASSPAVSNQYVYFGCYDGKVYCVDIIDGTIKWARRSFGLIKSSPLVYGNAVYIGSFDNNLYKLDTVDGGEIWVRNIQGQISSSPVLDATGNATSVESSISGNYKY